MSLQQNSRSNPAGVASRHWRRGAGSGALLELSDVHLSVGRGAGRRPLFQGLNLRVMPGDTVAIMGRSGEGKTTLLSLLGLMLPAERGSYLLNGADVTRLGAARAARIRNAKLGFVFQSAALLSDLNCAQNVELPLLYGQRVSAVQRRRRVHEALRQVGLDAFATMPPTRLSGGEQQRVGVARAMIRQAPILLADEPTGSLDPHTGERIIEQLIAYTASAKSCLVTVTHDPGVAACMQRCLLLREGRLTAIDPAEVKRVLA